MKIRFITSNPGKAAEIERIAEKHGVEIQWVDMEYDEIQADSLEFVARRSAEMLERMVEAPFFIEDSGLFIDALNGFPGVYSSYVFKTIGNEGILKLMESVENRRAEFFCVIAFHDGEKIHVFKGSVKGRISEKMRGKHGFGYDPIFEVNGKTFAEMGDEKDRFSHRRIALEKFFRWVAKNF